MAPASVVSGQVHRNDWFHNWLTENELFDETSVYKTAKDPKKLADLVVRAQTQQTASIEPISDRSIIAGRSLDLTGYLACGHANCLTRQVDDLFNRVWHYFDKIAITGPEAHVFLDYLADGSRRSDETARRIAGLARPIFHIRQIGAEDLVTWIFKPPGCAVHWKEYRELEDYHIPDEAIVAVASRLLGEGKIVFKKVGPTPGLILHHRELFNGGRWKSLVDIQQAQTRGESLEQALARLIVSLHWAGTASDLYAANSIRLPVGLGIGLEAKMAGLRRDTISESEVAFNLVLPVVDGLPVKELIALRQSENVHLKVSGTLSREQLRSGCQRLMVPLKMSVTWLMN